MFSIDYFFKAYDIPKVQDETAYFTGTMGYPQIDDDKLKQLLAVYLYCDPSEVVDELLIGLVSERDDNYDKVRDIFK